jgi:hypothetical protein
MSKESGPVGPVDPGPGPRGLYDSARLAQRLGISPVSLRTARHRGVDWLPAPAGELNGGPVWTVESLKGIEDRRRGAGRPRRNRQG